MRKVITPDHPIIDDAAQNPDPIYNRKQAARYFNGRFKPETFAKWDCTKRYDLKPFKVGRSVCYRQSSLDAFLAFYERQSLDPNFKKDGGKQ